MKFLTTSVPGIYTADSKKGKVYYGSYRCKITGKVKRRKLGLVKEEFKSKPKQALNKLNKILDEEYKIFQLQDQKKLNKDEYNNSLTLNDLKDTYFEYRKEEEISKLRSSYRHLTDKEFDKLTIKSQKIETVNKDIRLYEKYIEPFKVATTQLENIDQPIISEYQKQLNNTTLSEKSKHNILIPLRAIVNHSIKEGFIKMENPFSTNAIKFQKEMNKRERALTNTEIKTLLIECKKYNKPQKKLITTKNGQTREITIEPNYNIYLGAYLCSLTAGRLATILNIRKRDIDISSREIKLRNFKVGNRIYKQILPKEAIDWLVNKVFPYYKDEEYLIRPVNSQKRTGQAMKSLPKKLYEIMDDLFNQDLTAEDRLKKITYHNIRHSVATNLLQETNIHFVMKKLDHSSIIQTQNYLDLKDEELTAATERNLSKVFYNFDSDESSEPFISEEDNEMKIKKELVRAIFATKTIAYNQMTEKVLLSRTIKELEDKLFYSV